MKAATLKAPASLDNLVVGDREIPRPGRGEVLVRVHASSLNFHDYVVVTGLLPTPDGRIPLSDGAGDVVEVGDGVTEFSAGDRVVATFFPFWQGGEATPALTRPVPGDTLDGYAREYVSLPATAFTKAPAGYSHVEAATLTCAGLTAWRGLVTAGGVKPGDTVLIQGSGGVSVFALQFAKAAGATIIATSSSDEKLERLKHLGADHLINYKSVPDWGMTAKEITGGRGVDHVIEIGGPGTLGQSIAACRMHGHIALIGVLTGFSGEVPTAALFMSQIRVTGISVGSRADQEDMIRAITATGIRPVIDATYSLDGIGEAFRYFQSRRHFGKICLEY